MVIAQKMQQHDFSAESSFIPAVQDPIPNLKLFGVSCAPDRGSHQLQEAKQSLTRLVSTSDCSSANWVLWSMVELWRSSRRIMRDSWHRIVEDRIAAGLTFERIHCISARNSLFCEFLLDYYKVCEEVGEKVFIIHDDELIRRNQLRGLELWLLDECHLLIAMNDDGFQRQSTKISSVDTEISQAKRLLGELREEATHLKEFSLH